MPADSTGYLVSWENNQVLLNAEPSSRSFADTIASSISFIHRSFVGYVGLVNAHKFIRISGKVEFPCSGNNLEVCLGLGRYIAYWDKGAVDLHSTIEAAGGKIDHASKFQIFFLWFAPDKEIIEEKALYFISGRFEENSFFKELPAVICEWGEILEII